jgi:hypothetical protein
MRIVSAVVLVISALVHSRNQPYVGTWAAEQGGQIFVRLELTTANDTLGGRISLADIHNDPRGDVSEVRSALGQPTPISDLAWRNQTLTFARKEGDDIDRFEITLIGDGRAELRFVPSDADRLELAADGIPEPKPFRLTRIA